MSRVSTEAYSKSPQPSLCLVIPAYNEQDCIEKVLCEWVHILTFNKINFHIIVINDGSHDKTKSVLEHMAASNSRIVVINQKNHGHGFSVLKGYREALKLNAEWIFQVDADDQFYPQDFANLWKERDLAPYISGFRKHRSDHVARKLVSWSLAKFLLLFFNVKVRDANVPFRLYESSFLKRIIKHVPPNSFAPNVMLTVLGRKLLGDGMLEIPVSHKERTTGTPSINYSNLLRICLLCCQELWSFKRTLNQKVKAIILERYQSPPPPQSEDIDKVVSH